MGRKHKKSATPYQDISIIVAARNEAQNLSSLLESFAKLDYPIQHYEIIIVNDRSTDATLEMLQSWQGDANYTVIDWQGGEEGVVGKKAAVLQGIRAARFDILAFTDADCVVPPTWLKAISESFVEDVDYCLGYSIIKRDARDSEIRLKNFERGIYYALATLGMSLRKPITSMACNMAYRKNVFEAAGGFEGIGHLASGDDDLLLMKMMPYIRKAIFDPDPRHKLVSYEGFDIGKRYHTNIRRASKLKFYPLWLQALGVGVFLYFLLFYISLITLYNGFSLPLLIALLFKTGAELSLCLLLFTKLQTPLLGALYPIQTLLFPAQFIFYAVRGTLGKYRWK
ncbi:MAG: glycosyltransferase [Candidatus Cloacimonetes bacterium]|nr:glycosyltransferase [Candidatus Cloacimonadota bacterium]